MTIYILLLLLVSFFSILEIATVNNENADIQKRFISRKTSKRLFHFIILVLILIQGLRAKTVGGDLFDNYASLYDACGRIRLGESLSFAVNRGYEVGYVILNKICHVISNGNLQFLLTIIACIYLLPLARLINIYSENRFFGLFVFLASYMYNMSMNNLRSTIANGIIIFFLPFLVRKKYIWFLLGVGLASLFHQTSFIFLFFFVTIFISSKYVLLLISILAGFAFSFGYPLFISLISKYLPRYTTYLSHESNGGITFLAFLIFLMSIILILSNQTFLEEEKTKIFLRMLLCGILLQMISLRSPIFVRAVYYHLISLPILLPAMVNKCKLSKESRPILLFVIILCFWGYYIFFLYANNTLTVPYEFYFS